MTFSPRRGPAPISELDTGHYSWDGETQAELRTTSTRQTLGDLVLVLACRPYRHPYWRALYNLLTQSLLPCSLGGSRGKGNWGPNF